MTDTLSRYCHAPLPIATAWPAAMPVGAIDDSCFVSQRGSRLFLTAHTEQNDLMNEAIQIEQMPAVVRALRFIMIVQLAFSLFGAAIMIPVIIAAFSDPILFVPSLQVVVVVALMGWLVARWSSRRKWVRWCALAFEVVAVGSHLIFAVVDREFGWATLVHPATLLPLAIVVGLLTSAAARWFDR
ncbi:hypothetical protein ABZW49_48030 [Nonomuraea wenchangensis]